MEFGLACHVCSRGPVDSTPSASWRPTSLIYCHTATGQAAAREERHIKDEKRRDNKTKSQTLLWQEMQHCINQTLTNIVVKYSWLMDYLVFLLRMNNRKCAYLLWIEILQVMQGEDGLEPFPKWLKLSGHSFI